MKPRLLIIDDDSAICSILAEYFKRKDYDISLAYDGAAGVEKTKDLHPHLILLDLRMPVMDGLEALRQIRKFDSDVAVVIISGVQDIHTARQAMELGASDYVVKPLILPVLDAVVTAKIKQATES